MSSVAFVRNDGRSNIDPFRFGCKLHEVANMLLTNESICLVTQCYEEIPTLVNWLGIDNFHRLLMSDELRFTLVPSQPFFDEREARELRLLSMDFGPGLNSLHLPDARLERLNLACSHYLAPTGFTMPDELAKLIAAKTTALDGLINREFQKSLSNSFQAVVKNGVSESFPAGLEGLVDALAFDADGKVRIREGVDFGVYKAKSESLLQAVRELLIAFAFGAPLVHSSAFITSVGKLANDEVVLDEGNRAFREIVDLHGLPLIDSGVYTGEISAAQILDIRNSKQGVKFRKWLADSTSTGKDSKEILTEYANAASALPKRSLFWPAVRLGTCCGVGVIWTIPGVILSAADFVYSNFIKKIPWQPNFFIRGDYEATVSQFASLTQTNVPVDVQYLIARDYRLDSFKLASDKRISVKLTRNGNEQANLGYGQADLSYWASHFPTIVASQPGQEFLLECSGCKKRSRVISPGREITLPRCGHCRHPFFDS